MATIYDRTKEAAGFELERMEQQKTSANKNKD